MLGEERGCRELLARLAAPPSPPVTPEPPPDPEPPTPMTLKAIARDAAAHAERIVILETLGRVGWHRGKAARLLGVSRRALAEKLTRLGVERGDGHVEGPPAA